VAVEPHRRMQREVAAGSPPAWLCSFMLFFPALSFLYGLQILQFVAAIDDEKFFSTLRPKL
jgi:hypothetical protein